MCCSAAHGNDTFKYFSRLDSGTTATNRDIIKDFETGDTIDLSAMRRTRPASPCISSVRWSSPARPARSGSSPWAATPSWLPTIDGDGFGDFQIAVAGAVTFDDANLVLDSR